MILDQKQEPLNLHFCHESPGHCEAKAKQGRDSATLWQPLLIEGALPLIPKLLLPNLQTPALAKAQTRAEARCSSQVIATQSRENFL